MITPEEFKQLQEEIMYVAASLMLYDMCGLQKVNDEYYTKAVKIVAEEKNLPLRVFKDPFTNDTYICIGNEVYE